MTGLVAEPEQATVHLRLRGSLDGDDEVTALRQQLAACLASGVTDIRVHVEEQARLALRALQVLSGAGDWLAKQGGRLSVVGAGPAVLTTMKVYGLERLLAPAPAAPVAAAAAVLPLAEVGVTPGP